MMRVWMQHKQEYLDIILQIEAPADALPSKCIDCDSLEAIFRCRDCLHDNIVCRQCCLKRHNILPFHRVEKWGGTCFLPISLKDLGFILHIGHGGVRCPTKIGCTEGWADIEDNSPFHQAHLGTIPEEDESEKDSPIDDTTADRSDVLVISTYGVVSHRVQWCTCDNAEEKHIQLLRSRLFPGSQKQPKTAFTFNVLDYFHIDQMECKTAALAFYSKLRRLTNNAFPHAVAVNFSHSY